MKNPENTTASPQDERSIYGEVLDWMLAPLLFLWPISIALAHYFSENVANVPYDQALAEQVVTVASLVQVEPSPRFAQAPVLEVIRPWFHIVTGDGRTLAGNAELPASVDKVCGGERGGDMRFRDEEHRGAQWRIAYVCLGGPAPDKRVLVEIGETLEKRAQLANKIVISVIIPQFFLIPLAIFLVWFGLRRGLGPLHRLKETLTGRDPTDLSTINSRRVPEELEPLVEAFNGMLRRMKRNLDSQQRFIADAAHQIRTPLTGLKMQAQLAMRESDPQSLQHALRQIANSVDRANRLSHQLLTLARTESGEIGPQKHEPLDLDRLLRESIEDWIGRALEREIDLGYEAHGEAWVSGNAFILRELINNLIDNALRYTPPKGTVTCRVTRNGEFIILEIEDNGIGISLEQAELVFERFYRVDNSNTEGSGLGLAIVREIATQHGAFAALRPNPKGKGAVARVVFPAWEAEASQEIALQGEDEA